jgi:sugar phosphate isomerase/epimerase
MTRPLIGTAVFIAGRDEELWDEEVHRARAAGAEHLEIFLEYPPGNGELRERQARRLRNLVKGVKTLVHVPVSWPSLITPHERLRQLSLQEAKDTLAIAAKLSAKLVIIHGGPGPFPHGRHERDAGERFREGVRELFPLARELALPLAVENLASGYPATAEELEEALTPELKLSFNADQACESGQDSLGLLKGFFGRVAQIALGQQTELKPLVGYLKEAGFAGFLTLSFPPDPGRWTRVRELLARLRAAWEGA